MRQFLTFVLLAAIAIGGWLAWALWLPVTPSGQKFVMLRPGYSTKRIASELKSNGIIRSEDAFFLWHYFHRKGSLKAGEYLFERPATALDIHNRLVRGDVYFHTVVIPEGYTMFDIARTIEESGLGSSEDFLKVAKSDLALISDIDPDAQSLEGYLFPSTYQFTRTQTTTDMVKEMVREFRQVAQQIGLSADVHQMVVMASIVEKETASPDERPLVASVYYNRLSKKIALDADPSVIYAELLDGQYSGALHHADMQVESPYNTYRHTGLPPGPIGNPGRGALEAAMHPADSSYYYFVSDGNGHHRFAGSLEEHNKNVVAYRRAMRGQ